MSIQVFTVVFRFSMYMKILKCWRKYFKYNYIKIYLKIKYN